MRNWKEVCAKCADGEIEPTFCEYYGEPNGCNSPTYQEYPPVNNAAAMHEALHAIKEMFRDIDLAHNSLENEIYALANAALSAPPRNCDVGTAEEQTMRFRKFCSAHKYLGADFSYMCKGFGKGRCPFFNSHTKSQCEFAWAQMPYDAELKGEGNEND